MPGNVEIEAKIVLPDCGLLEALEDRLTSLGAVLETAIHEKDYYYQHPCRDFASTDEALRIRVTGSGGWAELTYKGPKKIIGSSKAREEISVRVEGYEAMAALLEKLGFRLVAVVEKDRRYYAYQGLSIALDRVKGLGCFVEIEAKRGGAEEVEKALDLLGLRAYPKTHQSYLELVLGRGAWKTTE